MRLEEAIKQPRFSNEKEKAVLNIMYTAAWWNLQTTKLLKPFDISWQQFNILRILRGRKGKPATVKLLTERMIDKMSNASRLVEKLRKKGLVERTECAHDRRRVDILLTDPGRELVETATAELDARMAELLADISTEQAILINELMELVRSEEEERAETA
jgi:DNA-binding MarR family transcriptional regulator